MRKWIDLIAENAHDDPTEVVLRVRDRWVKETDMTPYEINRGSCFDFADDLEREAPHLFQSMGVGNFFRYGGKWKDEPEGYDEDLIAQHWPNYKPFPDMTWEQMFKIIDWPGTHAWAYCAKTGLCYDVEHPEGMENPFNLSFFNSFRDYAEKNRAKLAEGTHIHTDELGVEYHEQDNWRDPLPQGIARFFAHLPSRRIFILDHYLDGGVGDHTEHAYFVHEKIPEKVGLPGDPFGEDWVQGINIEGDRWTATCHSLRAGATFLRWVLTQTHMGLIYMDFKTGPVRSLVMKDKEIDLFAKTARPPRGATVHLRAQEGLVEDRSVLPEVLYHGTTDHRWKNGVTDTLYLTVSRKDAENYADEAVAGDFYELTDGEYEDGMEMPTRAIVVEFRGKDLMRFMSAFEPDWGWKGAENATWQQSLAAVGSFCIDDFTEKHLGKVTPSET